MPWAPTSVPPPLAADEAHLWLVGLETAFSPDLLSPEEREAAGRYIDPAARRRHEAAKAALRRLLGGYLNLPPSSLRFGTGSNGKPFLEGAGAKAGIEFNISHSGDTALVAVARLTVGVDLEQTQRRVPVSEGAIASRFFTPEEKAAWQVGRRTDAAFFRLWTRKEAVLKAHGGGLGAGMKSFSVAGAWPPTGEAYSVLWTPAVEWNGVRYCLYDLDVGPRLHAALATVGTVRRIRQFTLA
jgi:4'-phosphopantetheinyl transferase